MKIAIITQPLLRNYGGILQAYALQHHLQNLGHNVQIIDYQGNATPQCRNYLSIIKNALLKYVLRKNIVSIYPYSMDKKREATLGQNILPFIHRNIQRTNTVRDFRTLNSMGFEAFVVGSDQVWRPLYNKYYLNEMFLTFAKDTTVKRIAYSASFGVSEWEFNDDQTKMAKSALAKFDAVSVRESAAVKMCQQYLNTTAQHVIDPTLLLPKDHYIQLINQEKENSSSGSLFTYIFTHSIEKEKIIKEVASTLGLMPFDIHTNTIYNETYHAHIPISVSGWLKAFHEAKFIITDSFHGVVFSIIFNKPFFVIPHEERGAARFDSLLQLFGLEERLINEKSTIFADKINRPIDWENVNKTLQQEREKATLFLTQVLK